MNKFLKKRPSDGPTANDDALYTLSQPASPTLKKSGTSRWKKNRKQPEAKAPLDLSDALPSLDEFRTSLIMPALSTRFSMLREQDDPSSKLGKASDDSVLQPRRKSRMTDFGYGSRPLFDIAEVSSLNGSIRPPLPLASRQHSFVSEEGYASEADAQPSSIMTRSRPGEGNILFGGRQKIYKIPTSGAVSTKSLGRLVYDDDVGMSAFQKYRAREMEFDTSNLPRPSDESQGFDFGLDRAESRSRDDGSLNGLEALPNDSAKDLSHSPSLSSYEKKRSTASSTARSDARSSTAATSIASQSAPSAQHSPAQAPATSTTPTGPVTALPSLATTNGPTLERSATKSRRLYEQGLDQHMQDQQTSAMSRLNSIQRQRGLSIKSQQPHLHNAKSTGSIHERAMQPVYAVRTQSPPLPSTLPALNTTGRSASPATTSPATGAPQSPLESHWDEQNVLTQALEPGDRGKATALGAFNKPAHAFDERQYLERQQVLQRSTSSAAVKNKAATKAAAQQRVNQLETEERRTSSDLSARSRSRSASKRHEPSKGYQVFQHALNQFPPSASPTAPATKSPLPDTHRTFFGNISASEDEEEDSDLQQPAYATKPEFGYYNAQGKWQPSQLQPVSEHPALRSQKSKASLVEDGEDRESGRPLKTSASSRSLRHNEITTKTTAPASLDSPTLPNPTQPLNGMMRHLREGSNHSSLYPADDLTFNEDAVHEGSEIPWNQKRTDSYGHAMSDAPDTRSVRESSYAISNPWDLDERSFVNVPTASRNSAVNPVDDSSGTEVSSSRQSRQSKSSFLQDGLPSSRVPSNLSREESEVSLVQGDAPGWQQELRRQHTRDPSTATQQERDAFANELAARRAAIQENMKSIVERDSHSRGTSPAPNPLRALGALRSKPSRESVAHAPDGLKGGRVAGANGSSTNLASQPDRSAFAADGARDRGNSSPRPPMPTAQHPAFKPEGPGPSTGMPRDVDPTQAERMLASNRSTPSSGARSRSNSVTANGRSRSRTGPYRDDLEKAMVEGQGSIAAAHTPDLSPFPSMSPELLSRRDQDYENARTTNYFERYPSSSASKSASSPVTIIPNTYTPGRTVAGANPSPQVPTPPPSIPSPSMASGTYTPIVPSSARPGGGLRRKTISKHDISEPTLISSTSNVDTVDLPEGASLKNGMEDPPPIPPINPRRRATRKLFGRHRSDSAGDHVPKATASDPNLLLNTSPQREYHFPPSAVVRMPNSAAPSSSVPHYGYSPTGSPERSTADTRSGGMQRAVTTPMDGAMF